jgi:hypothetical protein
MNLAVQTSPEGIADLVCDLAAQSDSADFSEIATALEEVTTRRAKIALRGVARLELPKLKGRSFVIAYLRDGKISTSQGIEFPASTEKAEKDEDEPARILVNDSGHPFWCRYPSMQKFCEFFDHYKMPYCIAYADD